MRAILPGREYALPFGEKDIARKRRERRERAGEVRRDRRIGRIVDEWRVGRNGRLAGEDDVERAPAVAHPRCPRRAAGRVAGGQVRREHRFAEPHRIAVVQRSIDLDRFEQFAPTTIERAAPFVLERHDFLRHGLELRAAVVLEPGEAAGVVRVRVAVEDDFDVGEPETERGDVRFDLRRRFGKAAVDQDQAARRDDQVRGDVRRAHVIHVAGDPERCDRLILRFGFGTQRASVGRQQQQQEGDASAHVPFGQATDEKADHTAAKKRVGADYCALTDCVPFPAGRAGVDPNCRSERPEKFASGSGRGLSSATAFRAGRSFRPRSSARRSRRSPAGISDSKGSSASHPIPP